MKEVEDHDRKELVQLSKPNNWDDKIDGNWEPQQLLWKPRRIDSSNYKDTWVNLEIDNPKSNKAAATEPANSTLEEVAIKGSCHRESCCC